MNAKNTSPKKFTDAQLEAALKLANRKFGHRKNVTGIDIGYKWEGDERTKERCVRVHVQEKKDKSVLEAAEVFPSDINGVTLDIIEGYYKINEAIAQLPATSKFPVLAGGISVGHPDITAGTLGCFVIDKQNNKPAILSNWHVLSGATGRTGDNILQPGKADGGNEAHDIVANLSRSILDADGDAAIAHLKGARPWIPIINETHIHLNGVRDSVLDEVLTKSGRTTGVTQARVDGEGVYFVNYQTQPGVFERIGIRGFKLVSVQPDNPNNHELSSGGDSGSVWYNANSGEAVGLHFAGEIDTNPRAEHAIACNMEAVMQRLNIRLASYLEIASYFTTEQNNQNYSAEISFTPGGPQGPLPLPPGGPWGPLPAPPRGPVWPWCPPVPDPWGPWRGGTSYGEHPWHSRNFGGMFRSVMGDEGSDLYRPGRSALQNLPIPNSVPHPYNDVFPRLQQALLERDPIRFKGIGFNEAMTDRMHGEVHSFIASTINRSSAFDDMELRRVCGPDFRSTITYGQVCTDISMIIATGSTHCGELKNA